MSNRIKCGCGQSIGYCISMGGCPAKGRMYMRNMRTLQTWSFKEMASYVVPTAEEIQSHIDAHIRYEFTFADFRGSN